MPHATTDNNNDTMTSNNTPLTNGNTPNGQSKFFNHLHSYPVVSDGVETFKSNPYGKKSLDLADSAYQRVVKPVEPYLETPYSYAKPYVTKADELADSGLGHVESHFPIVKEDTTTIVDKGKSFVWWPFKVADDGRNYVWSTWQDEYKRTANGRDTEGLSTLVLAIISTELRLASDIIKAVYDTVAPRAQEAGDNVKAYANAAEQKAEEYKKAGLEKAEEYKKKGEEYVGVAQEKGQQYARAGQEKGEQAAKDAQAKGEQVKSEAGKAAEQAKGKAGAK